MLTQAPIPFVHQLQLTCIHVAEFHFAAMAQNPAQLYFCQAINRHTALYLHRCSLRTTRKKNISDMENVWLNGRSVRVPMHGTFHASQTLPGCQQQSDAAGLQDNHSSRPGSPLKFRSMTQTATSALLAEAANQLVYNAIGRKISAILVTMHN